MIGCVVPYCRRTTSKHSPPVEWICGDHWRLVPRRWRRALDLCRRKRKPDGFAMAWQVCKRSAIERGAGL